MNKRRQPKREKVVPVPEKDLRLAEGAAGEVLAGHVDNPGQTPVVFLPERIKASRSMRWSVHRPSSCNSRGGGGAF